MCTCGPIMVCLNQSSIACTYMQDLRVLCLPAENGKYMHGVVLR